MEGESPIKLLGAPHWATRLLPRLAGLLGSRHDKAPLVLAPCNDVHTFGMDRPIDIAFVKADGLVVEPLRGVGCGRRVRCGQAAFVLERESLEDEPWPDAGEVMVLGFRREFK